MDIDEFETKTDFKRLVASTPDPNPGCAPRRDDVVSCAKPMVSPGKGTN